jgi:hypothetical protein
MHMHTSGSWNCDTVSEYTGEVLVRADNGDTVARVCCYGPQSDTPYAQLPNARLIAQAPAGLALAKHIIAMADDAYLTGHPEWQALVDEARALVAKVAA